MENHDHPLALAGGSNCCVTRVVLFDLCLAVRPLQTGQKLQGYDFLQQMACEMARVPAAKIMMIMAFCTIPNTHAKT